MFDLITLKRCSAFASIQHISKASWQKCLFLEGSIIGEYLTKSLSDRELKISLKDVLKTSLPLRLRVAIIFLWSNPRFRVYCSITARESTNECILVQRSSHKILS
jgi:hypothetical protein